MTFTLETAFRKSVSDPKWREAKVGDRLLLFGKEPPQFLYGDSSLEGPVRGLLSLVGNQEQRGARV